MAKFYFVADTIDGKIKDFPPSFWLECDEMKYIGFQDVRNYNGNECIQVMRVLVVYYQGQLLGTRRYKTQEEFNQERKGICYKVYCEFLVNGCNMVLNDCEFQYQI
jgi:hypothetical protein